MSHRTRRNRSWILFVVLVGMLGRNRGLCRSFSSCNDEKGLPEMKRDLPDEKCKFSIRLQKTLGSAFIINNVFFWWESWDIELAGDLAKCGGPGAFGAGSPYRPDRYGSVSDKIRKIRKCRSDSSTITNTVSLCLLFLVRLGGYIENLSDFYSYRLMGKLTDFFETSGVQVVQHDRDHFHFRHTAFVSQIKTRVGLPLDKTASLRINLNIDGVPITVRAHTHPSHSQTSRLLTSSSSYRHSYIGLVFSSRFIDS
jgi:hypothetical protein